MMSVVTERVMSEHRDHNVTKGCESERVRKRTEMNVFEEMLVRVAMRCKYSNITFLAFSPPLSPPVMEEEGLDDVSGASGSSLEEITLVSVRVGWLYFNPVSTRGRVLHLVQVHHFLSLP